MRKERRNGRIEERCVSRGVEQSQLQRRVSEAEMRKERRNGRVEERCVSRGVEGPG